VNPSSLLAAERVRRTLPDARPSLALIMGSGWRDVIDGFQVEHTLSYGEIPELGATQVAGHGGELMLARHAGVQLLLFSGRRHWYEGAGWDPIAFPIALAKTMGAEGVLLTNSAGGIRSDLTAGTLMIIDDHINLMGINPLVGPALPFWGPRFPDMSRVYDRAYGALCDAAAHQAGVAVAHGVYLAVSGPSYETPAEILAFRRLGADAVGMSTVPEAILAHAAGLRVAGLSCIANAAADAATTLSHNDVLAGARAAIPLLTRLLQAFVEQWAKPKPA
jgi:purine-nucleoside phosphorylase